MAELPDFDVDTALEPAGEGRFDGTVPAHWSVGPGPNGGLIAAQAVRALEASYAHPVRSLSLFYLAPPTFGPVEITVTTLREGRSTAFARVDFSQNGAPVVAAMAAMSAPRDGRPEFSDIAAPEFPEPDACMVIDPHRSGMPPLLTNYEIRAARDGESARPIELGGYIRSAKPRPLDTALVAAIADAWIAPAVLRVGELVFCATIDLTIHFRAPVPADVGDHPWVRVAFTSTNALGGTTDEQGTLWAPDGTLLAQAHQLSVIRSMPT